MVDEAIINVVKKFVTVLIDKGIPVEKAFLFGSYARNEANKDSDIDIMLVSDYFDTDDIYITSKPWRYAAQVDYRIEPIGIAANRFRNDDASPLIAIVKQEGVEILI